ncbi:WW domain-binding protein 11-like [Watersipora subatra]|uniref:WW domain-binding protein 11-like n=1 Tax=Watersipora subatra TaxID=2589382 RepID=UPI00355BFD39
MGKRSTTSTKSGKFMNPTDQARKEQRRKELKKNKKQRMAVRHAVLKGKDAQKIIFDLDEIDDMELNPAKAPPLSEKVLKDKRKKLMETLDRVLKLYEREEPEYYSEVKEMYDQYNERRARKQMYFDEVKTAERVLVDDIPLPEMPLATPLAPYDIPLPQPKSILKRLPHTQDDGRRKPPGPPPGAPPALSDSEEEHEMDTKVEKHRSIRFEDEEKASSEHEDDQETDSKEPKVVAKPVTPLQAAMLRMAAEKAAKVKEESQKKIKDEEVFAEHGNVKNTSEEPTFAVTQDVDPESVPLPPSDLPPGLIQPMVYRGPGGAPVIGLMPPAAGIRAPGMLPPGPPPGLPPAMRVHRLPGDLPPRLVRPHMNVPPPGMRPGMQQIQQSSTLSAPPSIMKPPTGRSSGQAQQDSHATISAKPIIKHHIGDVTRFTPTALKIKRDGQKKPTVKTGASAPTPMPSRSTQGPAGLTKDDAYDSFMKEIEGFI